MRGRFGAALLGIVAITSCGVTSGDSLNPCQSTIPSACGSIAHCVLANNQYLSGQFPGSQSFIVRTATPTMLTFAFEFSGRISNGTGLTLTSTEPDCTETSTFKSQGDIFQAGGASGILSFPITVTEPGDHLVQFNSDAYCSYQLAYQ
jgi:hypothetical protein